MNRGDVEKLLGGYATGTLTAAERELLFRAALEDQGLFEKLLAEEPLREALQHPAARARLLTVLEEAPKPWYYREVHPGIIAGVAAAAVIAILAVKFWPVPTAPPLNVVAQAELPQPAKSTLPSALTLPAVPQPVPKLPEAPAIAAALPANRPAIDAVLAQALASAPAGQKPATPADTPNSIRPAAAAFRTLAVSAIPPGLRFTVWKKLPAGGFAALDPGQDLAPDDETVIRFEPNDAGFLYVLERLPDGWRGIATEQVQPARVYSVPREGVFRAEGSGPREFLVVLSRQAQNAPERAAAVPGAQQPDQVTLTVTLRYP